MAKVDAPSFVLRVNGGVPRRYGVYSGFPKAWRNEDCCRYTVNGQSVGTETVRVTHGPNAPPYTYLSLGDGRSAWFEGWANDGDTITYTLPPAAPRAFECGVGAGDSGVKQVKASTERYTKVFDRYGYRCAYCHVPLWEELRIWHCSTEDHLVPKKHGGSDSIENLVPACQLCNSLKGDFIPSLPNTQDLLHVTERGRKQVNPEAKTSYFQAVKDEIERRRRERQRLFEDERLRIGRP